MILHLIHDDKVVPRLIDQFEEFAPGNNIFVCVTRKVDISKLRFLKNNNKVIMLYSKSAFFLPWNKIDKVCIHYLDAHKIIALWLLRLFHLKRKIKIIWFLWGGDIYEGLEAKGFKLYSDENCYLDIRKQQPNKSFAMSLFDKASKVLCPWFLNNKIDYIDSFQNEFNLFKKYYEFKNVKGVFLCSYYPLEDVLGPLFGSDVNGENIMIGNSASPTGNHEYVYKHIQGLNIKDNSSVILPMSYGVIDEYVENIDKVYKNIRNYHILRDFMPLSEYNSLMRSCSTFIYGNFRQEAWGNILIALYLGGKVYLSQRSPLLEYCKEAGFVVFELENISQTFEYSLSQLEKDRNRNLAVSLFSRERNKEYMKLVCDL